MRFFITALSVGFLLAAAAAASKENVRNCKTKDGGKTRVRRIKTCSRG